MGPSERPLLVDISDERTFARYPAPARDFLLLINSGLYAKKRGLISDSMNADAIPGRVCTGNSIPVRRWVPTRRCEAAPWSAVT